MVYGSLLAGARGIYYFAQMPRTRACLAEMRALCVELDAVAPALHSLAAAPALTCNWPAVMARAYATADAVWVVAVNTGNRAGTARFDVPVPSTGQPAVLFEDRTVPRTATAWEDAFGPYERHVYRLNPAP